MKKKTVIKQVVQPTADDVKPQKRPAWLTTGVVGLILLLIGGLYCLRLDGGTLSSWQGLAALLFHPGSSDDTASVILWQLNVPRVLIGAMAGCGLALSGTLMQGMTRNPLADPTLTGVAGGAALAIVAARTLAPDISLAWHPLIGIAGGILAAGIAFILGWRNHFSPIDLALRGLAVNAFAGAGIMTLLLLSGPDAASLFFWLSGGLAGRSWAEFQIFLPWFLIAAAAALLLGKTLNALALGDDTAQSLGLNLVAARVSCAGVAVVLAAASVSVAGPLAFVGLCIPHISRLLVGHSYRAVLPVSGLLGATLVVWADLLARSVAFPRELPAGFITAILATPLFIALLCKDASFKSSRVVR